MLNTQITIVILTNRNDKKFEQALKSSQFAKEILVIDNNSQNNWQKLKSKYNFTRIEYPEKISDYSKARNFSLKKVKTDWVLFLDSDEILPKNANIEIEQIISQNLFDAVSIKRSDYFLGKKLEYGETGTTSLIRMFKKNKGRFTRNVHEVVKVNGKIGTANFEISHFSHDSIKDFLIKISEYSYLESKGRKTQKSENIIQLVLFPIGKFFLNYFLKLGFLDGFRGLIYAVIMSLHSFFVRVFYYENIKKN